MSGCEGLAVKRLPIVLPVDVEANVEVSIITGPGPKPNMETPKGEGFSASIDKVDVRRYKRDGQLGDKCPSRK